MSSVYIAQGEIAVGDNKDMVISTILGSCISICLWDPAAEVGGMNHLLLPEMSDGAGGSAGAKGRIVQLSEVMCFLLPGNSPADHRLLFRRRQPPLRHSLTRTRV